MIYNDCVINMSLISLKVQWFKNWITPLYKYQHGSPLITFIFIFCCVHILYRNVHKSLWSRGTNKYRHSKSKFVINFKISVFFSAM